MASPFDTSVNVALAQPRPVPKYVRFPLQYLALEAGGTASTWSNLENGIEHGYLRELLRFLRDKLGHHNPYPLQSTLR